MMKVPLHLWKMKSSISISLTPLPNIFVCSTIVLFFFDCLDDLKTIRGFLDRHKLLQLPMLIDINDFYTLMKTTKRTSDFTFKKLINGS